MRRFIEVQVLLLAPIAPHWCEHMWRNVLKKEGSVTQAAWPVPEAYDDTILLKDRFLRQTMYRLRKSQEKAVLVRACVRVWRLLRQLVLPRGCGVTEAWRDAACVPVAEEDAV